jgi:hypothetical protein
LNRRRPVKTSSVVFAVVAAFGAIGLGSAAAQPLEPPAIVDGLQPQEILGIARANGFHPMGPPLQQGRAYVLRAIEPEGDPVHVVVDARSGRIVSVTPMGGPMTRYGAASPYGPMPMDEPPPSYGRPDRGPDGGLGPYHYGPMQRMTGPSSDPRPPGSVPSATPEAPPIRAAAVVPPRTPLPRPRPPQPGVATADVKTPEPAAQTSPERATPAPTSKDNTAQDAPATRGTTTAPTAMPPVTPLD